MGNFAQRGQSIRYKMIDCLDALTNALPLHLSYGLHTHKQFIEIISIYYFGFGLQSMQYRGKMPYNPRLHHRRTIRLKDYDYSYPGAYFVTVVTWQRECLFGEIIHGDMNLNPIGQVAAGKLKTFTLSTPPRVNSWIVMPNHVHFILMIDPGECKASNAKTTVNNCLADGLPLHHGSVKGTLPAWIQNYKSITSRQINSYRTSPGAPVWQRNYYEHIIRSWNELMRVSDYILDNPRQWADDPENVPY